MRHAWYSWNFSFSVKWGVFFSCLLFSLAAYSQYLSSATHKQLFDNDWRFFLGDTAGASLREFQDHSWRSLDLPHDWSIEGLVSPKNPAGGDGGYYPAGIGWYRKSFLVPSEWNGKSISVYFEGVYMNAEVFINGVSMGVYPYGYSSFSYQLTPHIKLGEVNVISVKVDNSLQKNCRWYSGSGIYRHVWLMVQNPVHVPQWGVSVSTTQVSSSKASVQIETKIVNQSVTDQTLFLKTRLLDARAKEVGSLKQKVEIKANRSLSISQSILVSNPKLWTPETPYIYKAQVQLVKDNALADETITNFGIRSIEFTAEKGFKLNGQTIQLNGGCVHHDNGCLGAAAYDRAEERKVELLKSAGYNAVRTSHNPPSEAFLDACDRLGLMVIDEVFDGWKEQKNKFDYAMLFDQWWQRDVEAMVLRDRNHPSIIMWSIGNEIIERKKPEAVETAQMLANAVRNLDPARPVTSAMTTWDKEWEIFDPLMAVHDVCGYNYQLHRARNDHNRVPSRVIVQTESYPRDAFVNWKLVKDHAYVIGDFVWTAMDYLGESGIGRWYYSGEVPGEHWERDLFPWHGAYCGDIDLTGWRKPISHYRNLLWNNTEKLYMAVREPNPSPLEIKETMWSVWPTWESWTWPGYEGKNIEVEVYSKYPKVRLYLNHQLVGEKITSMEQEYKAVFTIKYSPGELVAVGVENDKEVESVRLKSAGEAAKIKLTADRTRIRANGQDLAYVSVELTDMNDCLQPNANNQLFFEIEGPGIIAGVDNANVKDTDPYVSNSRKAWHGRALVVIKSKRECGDIKLWVSSNGLSKGYVVIQTSDW